MDKTLRDEQAGIHHTATLHIIIVQSLEWQNPLYSVFVDFQKAIDGIDRDVMWRLMHHHGFPPKFVTIIQRLYEDATCQVIHNGKLTEPCTYKPAFLRGAVVANDLPVGGQLDNAAGHGRLENWNTMDFYKAVGRPGLRR